MSVQLFDGDAPLHQPFAEQGIKYQEPTSRSSRTGWFCGRKKLTREEVAQQTGVVAYDLMRWEEATDLACEEFQRSELGDW